MVEEEVSIVINARDYATETLRGVTGTVRSLGMSTVMLASNFAMLTRELGIQSTFLNGLIKSMEILGVTFRTVGAAMRIYEMITKAAAAAEWLHSAALAFKIALIPIVGAAIVMGAMAIAASVKAMAAPSMQYGGVVTREGVYYLHPGEIVVPEEKIETLREREKTTILQPQIFTPALQVPKPEATILKPEIVIPKPEAPILKSEIVVPSPTVITRGSTYQTINVHFENRVPIASEIDAYNLLRDLGSVIAEKVRRG